MVAQSILLQDFFIKEDAFSLWKVERAHELHWGDTLDTGESGGVWESMVYPVPAPPQSWSRQCSNGKQLSEEEQCLIKKK
jgi:hypothetical protein